MPDLPFSATTPIHVSHVGLRARDAENVAGFYRDVVGLTELAREGATIRLGAGDRTLLEIEGSPTLQPDDPGSAGLFHTAFLLPTRADLARWAHRARARRVTLDGASDHLASEAIYLSDPEGNGIEIYADRPPDHWRNPDGSARIATLPLDFESLLSEPGADAPEWEGAPAGTVVGHVHLRVGDVGTAEEWWNAEGFDTIARYGREAVFLSTGGYHHHVGANVWRSRGAGPRAGDMAGLAFVELVTDRADAARAVSDPWGNEIRFRHAA